MHMIVAKLRWRPDRKLLFTYLSKFPHRENMANGDENYIAMALLWRRFCHQEGKNGFLSILCGFSSDRMITIKIYGKF